MFFFIALTCSLVYYYFSRQKYLNCNGSMIQINKKYKYRRFFGKENIHRNLENIVKDLQFISKECFGEIINYPIMQGKDYENKNIVIVYDSFTDKPVSSNISFYWNFKGHEIHHIGLYMIIPDYQKKGLQGIMGKIQFYNLVLNRFYKTTYITDLGRSATGFNKVDSMFPINYPSLNKKIEPKTINFFKEIALNFYDKYAVSSAGVSSKSVYKKELMVIKNSNIKEGGGLHQLSDSISTRESRNVKYNEYVNKLCPSLDDEFIIVSSLNFWSLLKYNLGF